MGDPLAIAGGGSSGGAQVSANIEKCEEGDLSQEFARAVVSVVDISQDSSVCVNKWSGFERGSTSSLRGKWVMRKIATVRMYVANKTTWVTYRTRTLPLCVVRLEDVDSARLECTEQGIFCYTGKTCDSCRWTAGSILREVYKALVCCVYPHPGTHHGITTVAAGSHCLC